MTEQPSTHSNVGRALTLTLLKRLGACDGSRDTFYELFGDQVVPTRELCEKHAQDFDWLWAVDELLSTEAKYWFETNQVREDAQDKLDEAVRAVNREYWAAVVPLRDVHRERQCELENRRLVMTAEEYEDASIELRQQLHDETAPLRLARAEVLDPLRDARNVADARAWCDAWIADPFPVYFQG